MKSILVDALRQAGGDDADKALSDSGSFEASQETLDSPANDILETEEGELELMSTTSALVVHDEVQDAAHEEIVLEEADDTDESPDLSRAVAYKPVEDDHAMTVAGMMPLPVTKRQAPQLARFAPLMCAVLAIAVAASWLLINKLGAPAAGLGTTVAQANDAELAEITGLAVDAEKRFPFIETGLQANVEEGQR